MPGLLDDPTFMAALGGGAQPPGQMPGGPAPAGTPPPGAGAAMGGGIPPQLLEMLKAKLLGGGGLPGAGAQAQMAGRGGGPDAMAAAAGQMPGAPNMDTIQTMQRMAADRFGKTPDPTEPGYVRAMKSLLGKGLISQEKYDALINDPHQYVSAGENSWQGSPRPLSDY